MPDINPLLAPIRALAALPKGASTREEYDRLSDALITVFPELKNEAPQSASRFGLVAALSNAVRATGLPDGSGEGVNAELVAKTICDAVEAKDTQRVYLCPLDYGAEFSSRKFGPCEIRKLSQSELEAEFQMPRLKRQSPRLQLDTKTLSLFQWLVVRETVQLPKYVGQRSFPMLYRTMGDYGEIIPHASLWPPVVEQAAFAVLLLPWEDLVHHPNFDWRPFRIPWVYTSERDPFVHLDTPKDADTLALEPVGYEDPETGEWHEWESPMRTELADSKKDALASLTESRWKEISDALASPIFSELVAHFLVRAFANDEIDEFLAHMIVIEAALGRREDHDGRMRQRLPGSGKQGATERVGRRVEAILSDATAYRDYYDLFDLRSQFIHGRRLNKIPSETRLKARRLARRVADALVGATSVTTHQTRDSFLSALCP